MIPALLFTLQAHLEPIEIQVRFEPIANLTYQLDNVTGQMPWEGSENYTRLWKREFLATPEDNELLAEWKSARPVPEDSPMTSAVKFPIEVVSPDRSLETRIRAAGFDSKTPEEYARNISKVASEKQAKILSKVVRHFAPKFLEWWNREALVKGQSFVQEMTALVESAPIKSSLQAFQRFYEIKGAQKIPFMLLYRPLEVSENTSGQQLGEHALVQFVPGEAAKYRIAVVIHELCHYCFRNAPPNQHAKLQKQFLDSGAVETIPAYNLLDEVVATALGNGIIEEQVRPAESFKKYFDKPESMYSNAQIDKGAKSIYAWVKNHLAANKSMFDADFAPGYLKNMQAGLGIELSKPAAFFGSLVLVLHESFGRNTMWPLREKLNVSGAYSFVTDLTSSEPAEQSLQRPFLSSLWVVRRQDLARLEELKLLTKADRDSIEATEGPTLWLGQPNQYSLRAVLVADSPAHVDLLVDRLISLKTMATGVVK